MSDQTLNRFIASGTAAERGAFTPSPPTPASGPDQAYFWYETDTGNTYAYANGSWEQVNGATIGDGDYGVFTVTGGVASLDAGVVTLANMANMATASVIYRKTAGTGAPEVQTLATLKTDLGLTGTNSGDQTITLSGDVSGSGTGTIAATIGNGVVTYAKLQDVTATDKILGRVSSGSGSVEEIACTAAGRALLDDANAAAQLTTLGVSAFAQTILDDADASTALSTLGVSSYAKTLLDDADAATALSTLGVSTYAKTLLDDADAATARTTLGVTAGGNLIGIRTITATGSGTYTPTSGTAWIVIELQGAGGGGGGCVSPGGTSVAFGRGGGGGGWLRKKLTADFSGASYSVGAKGTGGSAGNNAGSAGGDTTFTTTAPSSTTYTASGGAGGNGSAANTAPLIGGSTLGGGATGGDLNRPGNGSFHGYAISSTVVYGSRGGGSALDNGSLAAINSASNLSSVGVSANSYGGGGSGAVANGSGAAAAGGNGADGVIIIYEYS